jgi:hypothetical protein
MICDICIDEVKDVIVCMLCNKGACFGCHSHYLLNSVEEPHCMHCRKEWTLDFVESVFPKKFLKEELREHQKTILIARERSYLPATQIELDRKKKLKQLKELRKNLRIQLDQVRMEIEDLESKPRETVQKTIIVRHCPVNKCNGFLNEKYMCGSCNIKVCSKCLNEMCDNHVCNEDDIKNIELIKKDTKGCPQCGVRVFKISGCNQMFCTSCHVAFNWVTGKVEKGIIHNPHFFEWQRNRNNTVERNPLDLPCGGLPQYVELKNKEYQKKFDEILRFCIHVNAMTVPPTMDTSKLREKYLNNDIDDKKWGNLLVNKHKEYRKKQIQFEQNRMFIMVSIDIFGKLQSCKKKDYKSLYEEFCLLVDYYNKCSISYSKRFNNCVYQHISLLYCGPYAQLVLDIYSNTPEKNQLKPSPYQMDVK